MRKRALAILFVIFVMAYLLRHQWLPPIASWLNVSEPRLPTQYVIPLPGGNDARPFAAAALIRAGHAERAAIVVNELTPDVKDGVALPMHQVTRQVLLRRGVPEDKIQMLEGTSTSTFSDIQIIGGLFVDRQDATIAIVTSPSHTRRVRWTVDRILPRFRGQVCVIATYNDSYDSRVWWQDQGGSHEILSEYLKLIFYWLAYSSPIQRVLVAGMMLATIALLRMLPHRSRATEEIANLV